MRLAGERAAYRPAVVRFYVAPAPCVRPLCTVPTVPGTSCVIPRPFASSCRSSISPRPEVLYETRRSQRNDLTSSATALYIQQHRSCGRTRVRSNVECMVDDLCLQGSFFRGTREEHPRGC